MNQQMRSKLASEFCRQIDQLPAETRVKLYEIWKEGWSAEHPEKTPMTFEVWDKLVHMFSINILVHMFSINTDQLGLTRPEDSEDAE